MRADRKPMRRVSGYQTNITPYFILLLLISQLTTPKCMGQGFGGIVDSVKRAGGGISDATKKAGGDISNTAKKAGGDVSREGKKALDDAGKAIERPFRMMGENAKEGVFFAMRDHVVSKNTRSRRGFSRGNNFYYQMIQPHLPNGIDLGQISFTFDAYVPSGMAGITFGDDVYINRSFADNDPSLLQLMAHETGHVIQYRQLGMKGFARTYMDDVFGGWMRYPNFNQVKIHDSIKLEQGADEFAARVMAGYYASQNQRPSPSPFPTRPQQPVPSQPGPNPNRPNQVRLGVQFQIVPNRGGRVIAVEPGSLAQRFGIEVNDIIARINNYPISQGDGIIKAMQAISATGARQAEVLVENSRLTHLPIRERYSVVTITW